METTTIELNEHEREVLMNALRALEADYRESGYSDDNAAIKRLRQVLGSPSQGVPHPQHVDFNAQEYQKLMLVVCAAWTWRLSLTHGEDDYTMNAEDTSDETVWNFDLARGLKGNGRFRELIESDREFLRFLEDRIREAAPARSSQIVHEVVEIALPWDFQPDEDTDSRLVDYLISKNNDDHYIPEIHAIHLDVHSEEDFDRLGYASVLTEISWEESGIQEIKDFITSLNDEIKVAAAPHA